MIQNVAFACLCMFSKDGVHSLSKPLSEAEVLAAAAKTNTLTPYPLWDRAAAKTPTPLPPSPKPTPRHSKPPKSRGNHYCKNFRAARGLFH